MEDERPERPAHMEMMASAGRYMGYGLSWALSTGFFLLVGWWVDGKVGTTPLFVIVGAFVGGAAGFYSLYRHITEEGSGDGARDGRDGPDSR